MLTRLLPSQVSKFWNIIKYAVEQSLPPTISDHPDKINRVLAASLSGKVDVWASYVRNNGDVVKFEGIALTQTLYDDISCTRSLLIYCIYGYTEIDRKSWLQALETLSKYAKLKKCSKIVAYTEFPGIIEISKKLGADTKYTFISFDL